MANENSLFPVIDEKGSPRSVDQLIADLAERQHGVVGRRQLLRIGLGRGKIDGRIATGRLHPVFRGAYAVGHTVLSRDARMLAGVLASGDAAVASHRTAGEIWGLTPIFAGSVEVTVPHAWRSIEGVLSHRSPVPADERRKVDGIPVTSPPRTFLDLAAGFEDRQLERAFNEMEVKRLTDALSVWDVIERYPGRPGIARARRVLNGRGPGGITRNDFEEAFVALLDAQGLPRGRMNATISVRGQFFEPDCLWTKQRLMVELDGREVHGTERSFESDRRRDRVLLAEGWRTSRVTWRALRAEPEAVAVDLRSALARAA